MSLPSLAQGLDALPRRIFLEGNRKPIYDQDGFVLRAGEVLSSRDLLRQTAVLVVAPPWTGKTHSSEEIAQRLRESPAPCPDRSHLTGFERFGRGASVIPPWWEDWRVGGGEAYWLVDAVDDDVRREEYRSREVLDLLRSLPPDVRARLHFIAFARLNEVPIWFEQGLVDLYGDWSAEQPQGLRRLRLAGLDREEARRLVGAEHFERVRDLILANDLKSLAPYPSVLLYLRDKRIGESVTKEEVWRGILLDLLHRNERHDNPVFKLLEVERFEVAQRLAAISTFCGDHDLRLDVPGMEDLLPAHAPRLGDLRLAAREVLKTALFEPTENGFRFAQDHVREWLTAFALQDMPLLQVRPLLTSDSSELDPSLEGVMSFLSQVSRHPEVRDWIITEHGGLPDPDAVPWSLTEAAGALDQLQDLARTSPWGVRVWREERLGSFQVDGMGAEVARRLAAPLQPAEQQLLLDVASAIEAVEALEPAARLIQDATQDQQVRALAANLVTRLGTEEHLRPLAAWCRSLKGDGRPMGGEVISTLVSAFFEKGLWSFEAAAEVALSPDDLEHGWLQYRLAQDLSLPRARWLIERHVLSDLSLLSQALAEKAIDKILEEGEDSGAIDLIRPLILCWDEMEEAHFGLGNRILRRVQSSLPARRSLFLYGLELDPERRQGHGIWANTLEGEDTVWLLDLIRRRNGQPDWLWKILYFISRRNDVPGSLRQRARRKIREAQPELLKQLDCDQKKWAQDERKRREQSNREVRIYELGPLVRTILDSDTLDLRQKMLRLSQYCFMPSTHRPSNLSGVWDDLTEELREEVLSVCRQALEEAPATEIPDGPSYPSTISWEAACFNQLVEKDSGETLTSRMIAKWLPAVLRDWESAYKTNLRRCFEVDRDLSENLLLQEVRREIRSGHAQVHILQQVPRELWTERFSSLLEEVVQQNALQAEARIDLLLRIGRIFPDRARAIALPWADGEAADLRDAGIDLLLMVAPEEGWTRLKNLSEKEDLAAVLLRMRSLLPHHWGPDADFSSWPAARLGELEVLLFKGFPPDTDPKWVRGESRSLGAEDDLRSLRDKIPRLLYQREREGDHLVLDRLAETFPGIRQWLTDAQAQQGVQGVLAGLGAGRPLPGKKVCLEKIVKLLQESRYRVLGSAEDLQDVLLEELHQIAKEVGQHLSMLFHPRPKEKGGKRKRLEEDALQAYISCRLRDRLPAVLDPEQLEIINREPLAAGDTRNDIKVEAPSIHRRLLTVIIEIKWSDHRDVSTSLVDQLGEDYLARNGHSHGIYLVGWSGDAPASWKKTALGPGPKPRTSLEAWRNALGTQAELYQETSGLRIVPFVMDLSWPGGETREGKRSRP